MTFETARSKEQGAGRKNKTANCLLLAVGWMCLLVSSCAWAASIDEATAAYRAGRHKEALKILLPMALEGNATAQYYVGVAYARGKDLPRYDSEAAKWFQKSARQGYVPAQSRLGFSYMHGRGVERDDKKALQWFRMAAEKGEPRAQWALGYLYKEGRGVLKNHAEAMGWYRKAAEKGISKAQRDLGYLLREGGFGIQRDDAHAIFWLQKAANQKDVEALFGLGYIYENGVRFRKDEIGLKWEDTKENKDYKQAMVWYLRAAGKGSTKAFINIGNMYYAGRGVKQNYPEAVKWYRKAAGQGFSIGQVKMGLVYENGRGVKKNYTEAIRWYKMAAEQGENLAQRMLGHIYRKGIGVKKDYEEAYRWYSMAAAQGNESAIRYKRRLWLLKHLQKLEPFLDNVWFLTAISAFLFIPILIYPLYKRLSLKDFFGLIPTSRKCLLLASGLGLSQLSIAFLLDIANKYLPHISMERLDALFQNLITHQPISSLITIGLIAPFLEELTFRGFLQKSLYRFGVKKAMLISSAVFAILHPHNPLNALWAGLLTGYVFWLTGSLLPSILIHSINNSAAVLLMLGGLNLGWEISTRAQLILCLAFLPIFFVLIRRFIQEMQA